MDNRATLTRLAALGALSRTAGEGLQGPRRKAFLCTVYPAQSPSPALQERRASARQGWVGEGSAASIVR